MAHYFDREQDSLLHPKIIKFAVQGKTFEFIVGSGVFSKDRLDQGSRMLIEHGIIRENWRVLDMGCGYGPVGITVKQLYPSIEVTLADVNERAMELTKLNLKRYNLEADIVQSNYYEKIKGKFNTILLNPPQAAGKEVCFKLISDAKDHLVKGGLLQIVARQNVGGKTISDKMEEVFGNVEVLFRNAGYSIYISINQ